MHAAPDAILIEAQHTSLEIGLTEAATRSCSGDCLRVAGPLRLKPVSCTCEGVHLCLCIADPMRQLGTCERVVVEKEKAVDGLAEQRRSVSVVLNSRRCPPLCAQLLSGKHSIAIRMITSLDKPQA